MIDSDFFRVFLLLCYMCGIATHREAGVVDDGFGSHMLGNSSYILRDNIIVQT